MSSARRAARCFSRFDYNEHSGTFNHSTKLFFGRGVLIPLFFRRSRESNGLLRLSAVAQLRWGKIQPLDRTEIGDAPPSLFPRFRKRNRIVLRCGNRSRKALGIKDALADKCHCSLWAKQQTRRAREARLRPVGLT